MRHTELKKIFEDRGLPMPPGELLDARWQAGTQDWWAKTTEGWFWMRGDGPKTTWHAAPLGPPGENP